MKKPSVIEKISGSLPVTAGATILSVLSSGPVAALLPVLTTTLANNRHKVRIEAVIEDINSRLSEIENIAASLTDPQYKLINEIVISIIKTPDDEKITYLKNAIYETPLQAALTMHDSTVISRVLNDISIGELKFLLECHGNYIVFGSGETENFYHIDKFTDDGERAVGLISLGLLARSSAEGTASDIGAYHFTPLADKLLKLIAKSNT